MTWLIQTMCGWAGHDMPIPMKYTKRQKLMDENDNWTGFYVVTEHRFLQCSRCNKNLGNYTPEKMVVRKEKR